MDAKMKIDIGIDEKHREEIAQGLSASEVLTKRTDLPLGWAKQQERLGFL